MSGNRTDIYIIPPNFAEEGTLFSGRIKTRNAVETVILVFFLLQLLLSLNIGVQAKIYAGVIIIIPATVFAALGVQGESLSTFIFHFLLFLKNRRVLTVPTGRHRLERNRRLRKRAKNQRGRSLNEGGAEHGQRSGRAEKKVKRGKAAGKAGTKRRTGKAAGNARGAKKAGTRSADR